MDLDIGVTSLPFSLEVTCLLVLRYGFIPVERTVVSSLLGTVVESDLIAVRIGKGKRSTEGAINWCGDDAMPIGEESIMDGLDVCSVEPDRGTDAGLNNGSEIGTRNDVSECERDRLRLENDSVRRSGLRTDEAEVLFIEFSRSVEVARLERDEVRTSYRHDVLLSMSVY